MKKLLLLLLLVPITAFAKPLELVWDRVTEYENGDIIPVDGSVTLVYKVYKKPQYGEFQFVWETKNNSWTWLVPSIGHFQFYVTAYIHESKMESKPSNIVKVVVERIGREED